MSELEIQKLIDRLRNPPMTYGIPEGTPLETTAARAEMRIDPRDLADAASAISTLLEENRKLREQIERMRENAEEAGIND